MAVVQYDTDGISQTYTTLSGALSALPDPLTEDSYVYGAASTGVADTITATIGGEIPDLNGYRLLIQPIAGQRAKKDEEDSSILVLLATTAIDMIQTAEPIEIDGLQIVSTGGGTYDNPIIFTGNGKLTNCRVRSTGSRAMYLSGAGITPEIIQNIIESGSQHSIRIDGGHSPVIYHNVIKTTGRGVYGTASDTITAKNNLFIDVSDCFYTYNGASVLDYNVSLSGAGGRGTDPITPSGSDWDNEVVDESTSDYTAIQTGNISGGVGPSADANVPTTDIEGDTRSGATTYCGVDEYVAAGGIIIPTISSNGISSVIFGGQIAR